MSTLERNAFAGVATKQAAGIPLLQHTLRNDNAKVHGPFQKQANMEVWLDNVMMHGHNKKMKDPNTNDESTEDVWASARLQPIIEEKKSDDL